MSSENLPRIAFLGTGGMGALMARNLLDASFEVRVWNRTRAKAEPLAAHGATVAESPEAAVADADVVLSSLFDGPAVHAVIDAAAPALRAGAVWADLSTVGVEDVARFAESVRARGASYVHAPVQGALPVAERGELLIYAAGPASARPVLEPIFELLGRRTDWVDEAEGSSAAAAVKLVVNGWLFALTTASAEAVALAQGLGVDPERFRAAIAGGPLDNAWAQLKSEAILAEDFTPLFPVAAALKDSDLIVAAATSTGVRLDLAAAVRERFERTSEQGHAGDDMVATYFASFDGTNREG